MTRSLCVGNGLDPGADVGLGVGEEGLEDAEGLIGLEVFSDELLDSFVTEGGELRIEGDEFFAGEIFVILEIG